MISTKISKSKMSRPFFTEEHKLFRNSLRKFLQEEAVPYYEEWEKNGEVPREFWRKAGENGFLCAWVDEEYGGLGLDFGFSIILGEECERVGSGLIGIPTSSDIVVPYINSFGSKSQKEKYLPGFVTGEKVGAVAMTEPGSGSDLASMKTTAIKNGDKYILNGSKTFITNGYYGDVFVVACKTDPKSNPPHKGVSLLILEKGTPGFSITKKLNKVGMKASDTAELFFDNVEVPIENLLGKEGEGFNYLMQKLQQERLCTAANALIAAEDMLELTINYVKERQAFGKPISEFQNTQFKIAEIATEVKIGRTFVDDLIVKHIDEQEIVTEVSMAKYWVTNMAKSVSSECMQLHGGYGYMEEYKIARRYRDIPVYAIFAGTNEIMKKIIAKNIGL